MVSALLIHGVPIECINKAAETYYVPAMVIISVLNIENGKVGTAHRNTNGTFDLGPMQINSLWLSKVEKYGYTTQQLQYDPCVNVMVGTWILGQRIANSGDYWRGVGDYHSYSYAPNQMYQTKVWNDYELLFRILNQPSSTGV